MPSSTTTRGRPSPALRPRSWRPSKIAGKRRGVGTRITIQICPSITTTTGFRPRKKSWRSSKEGNRRGYDEANLAYVSRPLDPTIFRAIYRRWHELVLTTMEQMQVVILCGGMGTRIRDHHETLPK